MNDIDYMIAVMQAAKEGKTIQRRSRGRYHDYDINADWYDTTSPIWNWAKFDYRVKPAEPRRVWVNMYCDCMGFAYASREQADDHVGIYRAKYIECVEFVEVMK